jgi:hypothetical protein
MAKGAKVRVYGDWDGSAVKKAEKDLNSFGDNVKKGFATVGAAVAGAFALTEVTQFLKDATQAAIEDEKSMVSLAKAMENMGLAAQNAGVEQFVEQLMLATGVADDQLRPAMSRLLLVTGDVAESQRGLQLAMDIAAGTGRDLDSVTTALAKAYGGQTTALGRLGVGLDQATLRSKDMDLITGALSQKFEGQAAAAADTYGGRIQRLNVAVGEAQETIGYALLNALDDVTAQFGGSDGFTATVAEAGEQAATLVAGVGALATGFANLAARLQTLGGIKLPSALQRIFDVLTAPLPLNQLRIIFDGLFRIGTESQNAARKQEILEQAMQGVTNGVPRFIAAMGGAEAGLKRFSQSAAAASFNVQAFYGVNPSAQRALAEARANVDSIVQKYNEAERAVGGVGSATAATTDKQEKFNQKLKEKQDALKTAIQGAKDYAVSVAKTFTDALDLSSALDAAKESGKSIVDEFIAQGERMGKFAENMQKLLAANLSRPAFDAIIRAGVERGADIANALAQGNIAENVRNVNRVYASVAQMGDIVGQRASYNFEQAGIITAQGFLENFIREFMPAGRKRRQLLASIDEMVNAALQNMSRMMNAPMPSLSGGGGGGGGGGSLVTAQGVQVPIPVGLSPSAASDFIDGILMGGAIPFAKGGIVTSPTLGLVGEAGPEAIIPLNRGGVGTTINLTVNAGMGTDGGDVGRQIVDALRQYERRNGPVPITVR